MESIRGGIAHAQRRQIRFVNDFDMSAVKRFYIIRNADMKLVRGWRAHRIEQRWFYVLSGAFALDLVKIDDFACASMQLPAEKMVLTAEQMQIVHLPAGYGTAFQATIPDSKLLV